MALPPLATAADLQARSSVPLTGPPERIDAVLADASAAVRAYSTQEFTRSTTTDWMAVRQPLRLPQRPVNEVIDVTDPAGEPVSFAWDGLDTIDVDPFQTVVAVEYDHGYDEVPPEVLAIVCSVAGRTLATPPGATSVTQESITNYSVSFGPVAASGASGLFNAEAAILDRYRRVAAVTWMR